MIKDDKRATADAIQKIAKKATEKPKKAVSTKRQQTKIQNTIDEARNQLKPNSDLELVTDIRRLREYVYKIADNGICALDTETTGLDPMSNKVVGICLYTPNEKAIYVPCGHVDTEGNLLEGQISERDISVALRHLHSTKIIYHNAKFDLRFIRHTFGNDLPVYFDTSLAGQYLNENESHKLKYLHGRYVLEQDEKQLSFGDLFEGMSFEQVPLDIAYIYASGDAIKTYQLYEFYEPFLNPNSDICVKKGLKEAGTFFHEVEIPLIKHIADMEDRGVLIDKQYATKLSIEYTANLRQAEADCQAFLSKLDLSQLDATLRGKLGSPINLNSPTQLAIIIYDVMGLKSTDKLKPRGTGAEILEAFATNKKYGSFFTSLLKVRELTKLLGTYIDKLPQVVKDETGAIHASFNQFGAKTGRFSSSEPNLQNIPASDKNIRKMFVARPDHVFISCDYSQQEPRVLAHCANDAGMINAYATGKDLYSWIASEVYKVPYDDCKEFRPDGSKNDEGKKRRNAMKSVVLGLMYGRGAKAIAEQLQINKEQAQSIINMFFGAFPSVYRYIQQTKDFVKQNRFVQTCFGRKRRLPEIALPQFEVYRGDKRLKPNEEAYFTLTLTKCRWEDKEAIKQQLQRDHNVRIVDNGGKIAEAERQSVNSIIQGTSADITKKAMLALATHGKLNGLGAKMILTVHDEIIMEAPKDIADFIAEEMAKTMIDVVAKDISVPMKVDSEITDRWYGEPI